MKFFDNCYRDIDDLPIDNWNKIHTENNFKYLILNGRKVKIGDHELRLLSKLWRKLYDQYIKEFGFGDNFLSIIEKQKEIALLKIQKCETGDENIQTFIELAEVSLDKKKSEVGGVTFHELKAYMGKFLGFQVDTKKMSVMDFYSNLKLMENERSSGRS